MKCVIESYAISVEPFSTAKGVHKCVTHDWMIEHPLHVNFLCPIGRIEEARDDALAAIKEARAE